MRRLSVFFLLFGSPAFADSVGFNHMMDHDYGYGMMFGPVLWILVLGLVVAAIIWLVRNFDHASQRLDSSKAMSELDLRFARGEIDADEYSSRKKLLSA